jgi:hypothetical protein
MKPPAENIDWRKIVSVPLDNDTPEVPGDWVGVVTKWKMPGALDGVTASDLLRVQKRVAEGKWREDSRATAWVGKAVAEVLTLDARDKVVRKRIISMLAVWIASGALKIVEGDDDIRHKREFVMVGEWAV